ncbi:alpha/beta-hydrolase [Annulohypoxylon maeteangense]|uniref:alpha/beta-hydrolase n=1 Tax=Annulohypoxylon maeteangense TaxID=1927788 RepID=UPI002007D4FF|nr:alpha/beta-hydrolase [Annulohypoxylon maeteangense]KAI0884190.1 alpha/beta-hydrolase [Annulohypoxylon maeteangense]
MRAQDHALIGTAKEIPINSATPVYTFSPIVLPFPDRLKNLEVKVTFPSTGTALPIVIISHGQGQSNHLNSLEGYTPLAEFWAAHGFIVVQPSHLSGKYYSLDAPKGQEYHWQDRSQDIIRVLDSLDAIEAAVPALAGRLDKKQIAIAGHSLGAWTAAIALGAKNISPFDGVVTSLGDSRIKAGVVLTGTGKAGDNLSEMGRRMVPFYGPDYDEMHTPALIVCGDEDVSPHFTPRGADWHADPYFLSPGPKDLLWIKGAKHGLGGVSGWDAKETEDEGPQRLAAVQRLTTAYLRSALYPGDGAWEEAVKALALHAELGSVESKK